MVISDASEMVISDASACFEQASPDTVLAGLELVTDIAKARGYKGVAIMPSGPLVGYCVREMHTRSDGSVIFSFERLRALHLLALDMRLVVFGDVLFQQLEGVPIGGLMSKVHVSMVLNPHEWSYAQAFDRTFGVNAWKRNFCKVRYVDDVFSCSLQVCASCQHSSTANCSPMSFERESQNVSKVNWLDVTVTTGTNSRSLHVEMAPPKAKLLPYFGHPPIDSRSRIRGVQSRIRSIYTSTRAARIAITYQLDSWVSAGYPRALVHAEWLRHLDAPHLSKLVKDWFA